MRAKRSNLLGHRDNACFSRNRLSDRGKQHSSFCCRSSEVALMAQRLLETSKVRLCGKPLAKRKPEGQVRIFPKNHLFDRDCFVACAPRNDTPSSLMRCHCCSFDRLLGHRDNAYFSRNRLSDRGKQHFPFCYRSSEVALLAQRFLETSKVRLCGKPLAKRKPEGQVRIFPKNLFFDRDCFVACAPRNDTPSSLMRCHCCSFDRLPLFWNAPLDEVAIIAKIRWRSMLQ